MNDSGIFYDASNNKGRWIWSMNKHGASAYSCPECGHWHPVYKHESGWNYCPYCGEKLDGLEGEA